MAVSSDKCHKWMQAVDTAAGNIAFRDLYDSGATAQEATEEALAGADFPFDYL